MSDGLMAIAMAIAFAAYWVSEAFKPDPYVECVKAGGKHCERILPDDRRQPGEDCGE